MAIFKPSSKQWELIPAKNTCYARSMGSNLSDWIASDMNRPHDKQTGLEFDCIRPTIDNKRMSKHESETSGNKKALKAYAH
jgi:hypothetical protein